LKLSTLLVLTLFVVCCSFASAQTFGFGTAIGGSGLYCNFEQLSYAGSGLYGGVDNLEAACDSSANSTVSGFAGTVANDGEEAHGAGVIYGDSIYAVYDGDPYAQWTVFSKLKCNKTNKFGDYTGTDGWEGAAAFSGEFVGTNQGPLSCNIPGKDGGLATRGTSSGSKADFQKK
jgi:hypothetical protein